MTETNFEAIVADLNLSEPTPRDTIASGKTLTIWLPAEDKALYDRIQKLSGRRLSRKIREVVQGLLRAAEAKAS